MIKDLFAIVDHAGPCEAFLMNAVGLAEAHGAHLEVGVLATGPVAATEVPPLGVQYVPGSVVAQQAAERVEAVRLMLARARCPVSVLDFRDDVLWLAGDFNRTRQIADLLLVGPGASWDLPWLRRRIAETMILSSGTPIVLLPEGGALGKVRHAVLGWKPSREANRAVHELVALAEPGAHVDIVAVGFAPKATEDEAASGTEVKRHLERHGLHAEIHWLYDSVASEAELLQRFAMERHACLIAVGGFAHSRLREILLGGVTRDLVGENRVPVLIAH